MASMRSIKRRKESVQSTQQITKAMKLVSTVKLQRAKTRAEQSKAYFECMYKTVKSMIADEDGRKVLSVQILFAGHFHSEKRFGLRLLLLFQLFSVWIDFFRRM